MKPNKSTKSLRLVKSLQSVKSVNSVVLVLLFLLVGCGSPNQPVEENTSYFPCAVGNKWYYASYPDSVAIYTIWEMTNKQNVGGKDYYEVIRKDIKYNYTDTIYFRLNADTLFCKYKNSYEQIWADFSLKQNETTYWQNDLKVTKKTNELMTFETPFDADYGHSVTYKKGCGITKLVQNGFVYYELKLIKTELK